MKKIESAIEKIITAFAYVSAAAIIFIMLITAYDILDRLLFNKTVSGVIELVELAMVPAVWFGLPLCALRGDMIIVDIFKFPRLYNLTLKVITFVGCVAGAYAAFLQARKAKIQMMHTAIKDIQTWPYIMMVSLGFLLIALAVLVDFKRSISKDNEEVIEHKPTIVEETIELEKKERGIES